MTQANLPHRQSSTITSSQTPISTRIGSEECESISINQHESTDVELLVSQRPPELLLDQPTDFDLSFNALQSSTTEEQELDVVSHWLNSRYEIFTTHRH